MGRIVVTVTLAAVLAGIVGWYFNLFTPGAEGDGNYAQANHPKVDPATLGDWLYGTGPEEMKGQFHKVPGGKDTILLQGSLVEIDKVDVPSQVAGQVLYIGEGVPEGVTQVAGIAPFMQKSYEQASVVQGGRYIIKFYRPMRKGAEVQNGQLVGEIDFARALNAYLQHRAIMEKAIAELKSAQELAKEAAHRLKIEIDLKTASSARELADARLTYVRTFHELVKAEKELEKELVELDNAKNLLAYHQLRFNLPIARGFIKTIYHDTGEGVKESEPVLHIYGIDRLLAEAFVELPVAARLRDNMTATIEPAQDELPQRMFEGHRKAPITSVSFVNAGDGLYLVSTSEDGYLKLWRQDIKGAIISKNLGEPIKAAACSPRGVKQPLCVVGGTDGKLHLWNLFPDGNQLPRLTSALTAPIDAHRDAVTAVAFSPDGTMIVSGGADGTIKIWNTADGKSVYPLDPAHGADDPHQGAITALSFTPQSQLVSAGRDNTLRVWNLKKQGAYLEGRPISGRSGTVNQLGVSQDGRWMLFDQGRSLQLMAVPNDQTINTLKNPGGATPFETLALFSPDASLVLTGGAAEGRLQLWKAPTESSRGYEVRQFVTEQRSPVTCAAFAPILAAGGTTEYAASGTKDGFVYLWPVPKKKDIDEHCITNVPVRQIPRNVDGGNRQIRIGVEVPNLDGRLYPGRPVTIAIE